jgi:hypothetical protein
VGCGFKIKKGVKGVKGVKDEGAESGGRRRKEHIMYEPPGRKKSEHFQSWGAP